MTRRLYYEDSHVREFDAQVVSCGEREGAFEIVLDKTAFFPEGGGNPADTGTLGRVKVLYTFEWDGEVVHRCDGPLPAGSAVHGAIDWDRRFSNMQNHSAEHIVSGIVHQRHGFANVGFHMGEDGVIVDFDGFMDDGELSDVEREANEAVWRNAPVTAWFPSPEELGRIAYRSKLELTENVRLVAVEGVDVCACCAPHVKRTGEIGVIKIFESIRRKNGVRLRMLAGSRAYEDYVKRARSAADISALLSTPRDGVTQAVERVLAERDAAQFKLTGLRRQLLEEKLAAEPYTEGNLIFFQPELDMREMQSFASAAREKCAVAAVFSGDDESGYRYVLASKSADLRVLSRDMNEALHGRGGGRPEMVSGSVSATREEIEGYWR